MDTAEPTTFYGACTTCGAGYWADVVTTTMCGPALTVVCQRHLPVSAVELHNSHMFGHEDRRDMGRRGAREKPLPPAPLALRAAAETYGMQLSSERS